MKSVTRVAVCTYLLGWAGLISGAVSHNFLLLTIGMLMATGTASVMLLLHRSRK